MINYLVNDLIFNIKVDNNNRLLQNICIKQAVDMVWGKSNKKKL